MMTKLKLYLFSRIDSGHDEYDAKAVLAYCETDARDLANLVVGDEGTIWNDPNMAACKEVDLDGIPMVVLDSFNAG